MKKHLKKALRNVNKKRKDKKPDSGLAFSNGKSTHKQKPRQRPETETEE